MENFNRHAWEQWHWVWHTLAYGLMAINLIVASVNDLRRGSLQTVALLTVILALWYLLSILTGSDFWKRAPWSVLFYFLFGWTIWLVLIYFQTASMMLAAFFYPQVFLRLPFRWAITGSIFLTVASFLAGFVFNSSPANLPTYLLIGALLLISQITLSGFINALITQSGQRYKLLYELQQTRAELARAERESGTLAERQRLAREIHDTLAQDFTSIVLHLTAARLSEASAMLVHLQQAEQTARAGLEEARRIVWALRPEQLEHTSFAKSLEQLAGRFSVENSIQVETTITGLPRPLGPEKESALFRITQEALSNVKKHARAVHVTITLSYMSDLVALDIIDDGIGFEQDNPYGFGLKTMRERVHDLGGTLTLESDHGTAIAISLPIHPDEIPSGEEVA